MNPQTFKVACSNCNLRELCMPVDLSAADLDRIDTLVDTRRKILRGESLYHNGESFHSLFAIRTGFFKTSVTLEDGREQVTGFQMAGEIMGLDGIVSDHHTCDAVALENAEVCVMPFEKIEELSREVNALQHHVHKIMSREIVREHGVMMMLGSMRAEGRFSFELDHASACQGFLPLRIGAAHDPRRNWQLSGIKDRNRQPHIF